jgi:hypothetical protein
VLVVVLIFVALFQSIPLAAGQRRAARRFTATATSARPDVIVLENGATTFVSSLEEHLVTQTEPAEASSPPEVVQAGELHNSTGDKGARRLAVIFKTPFGHDESATETNHHQLGHSDAAKETTTSTTTTRNKTTSESETRHGSQRESASSHGHGHGQHHEPAANSNTNQSQKPIPQHWQVKSLLNVTHDYPLAYSQIICGYVWPLMAGITLFTNLMIVFVLTQKDMRTPTNVVLTAIAIADIIPIVVPVPWFVYLFAMGNEKQVLYPPIACYFYQHSTRSVSEIFYFLSTWLNVLLAVQDYLVACRPKLAQKYCQIRVVIIEIVLLTLLAFLLNLPQALKLVFKPVKFYYNGQITWGCKALQARWFKEWIGEHVALYDDIFTAIIVLFVDGGPAVALITLTALLIRQLQRQRIQGHLLMEQARTASKRRRERHRQQESEASARVMIFVLLAFLAVKIPFATTYTLMIIQSRFEIHFVENLVDFQKAITLTDLVFVLSYPINFTIFCCCSKKFRHKCAQLLGECNQSTRAKRDRFMSSINSDSFIGRRLSSFSSSGGRNSSGPSAAGQSSSWSAAAASAAAASRHSLASANHMMDGHKKRDTARRRLSSLMTIAEAKPAKVAGQGSASPRALCNGREHGKLVSNDSAVARDQLSIETGGAFAFPPQPTPPSPQLKALLENGGLCLECVMRYEKLRSICESPAASDHQPSPVMSPAWTQAPPAPASPTGNRAAVSRAQSAGSFTRLFALPPSPPAPRSLASFLQEQQRLNGGSGSILPQIITTACESIEEQQSASNSDREEQKEERVEEASKHEGGAEERLERGIVSNSGAADMDEASAPSGQPLERPQDGRQQQQQQLEGGTGSVLVGGQAEGARATDFGPVDQTRWQRQVDQIMAENSRRQPTADTRRLSSKSNQNSAAMAERGAWLRSSLQVQQQSDDRLEADVGRTMAVSEGAICGQVTSTTTNDHARGRRPVTADIREPTSSELSSDSSDSSSSRAHGVAPGGGRSRGRTKAGEQARRKGRKSAGHRGAANYLGTDSLEERKRSLSLSNSNLTTLPNATGMLADVLVSFLFSGGDKSNQGAGGGQQSRAGRK